MADVASLSGIDVAPESREARYYATGTVQTVATSTDSVLYLSGMEYDTPYITRTLGTINTSTGVSTGSRFTINRTSLWRFSANARFSGNGSTTGERYISICEYPPGAGGIRYAHQAIVAPQNIPLSLSCTTDLRLNSGTVVCVGIWQTSGAVMSLDYGWTACNFSLTWIRD